MDMKQAMILELQALYGAEQQFTQQLQRFHQEAQDPQLKQGFEQHLRETEEQIRRLEQAFQMMGQQPTPVVKQTVQAMAQDAEQKLQKVGHSPLRDHCLTALAQVAEHYEIACYGTARAMAEAAGNQQLAQLLEQTLQEEKTTDQKLTDVGERLLSSMMQPA